MFLKRFLLSVVGVYLASFVSPGVHLEGFATAIMVSIVLGLLNISLGLLLKIFLFPLNFLTLGLVGFVINVAMITFTDSLVEGFSVDGFLFAAIFAIFLSLMNFLLHQVFTDKVD